jgi:H+/gluconate symporter-like permease
MYRALALPMNIFFIIGRGVGLTLLFLLYLHQAHWIGNAITTQYQYGYLILYAVTIGFTIVVLASYMWTVMFALNYRKFQKKIQSSSQQKLQNSSNAKTEKTE